MQCCAVDVPVMKPEVHIRFQKLGSSTTSLQPPKYYTHIYTKTINFQYSCTVQLIPENVSLQGLQYRWF
jgi:hypothetical protein